MEVLLLLVHLQKWLLSGLFVFALVMILLFFDNIFFRMTSDGSLPADKRRNYSSVFNAIARIYKVGLAFEVLAFVLTILLQEEGVTTLWRGATPTMARSVVTKRSQLVFLSTV